jgi:hypothetical protein
MYTEFYLDAYVLPPYGAVILLLTLNTGNALIECNSLKLGSNTPLNLLLYLSKFSVYIIIHGPAAPSVTY